MHSWGVRDVLVTQIIFGGSNLFHICAFFQGPKFFSFVRCCMRNPAKYIAGVGFFLRKKGGPSRFTLSNKVGFDCDLLAMCFIFFVIKIEGFLAGWRQPTWPPSSLACLARRGSHDCNKKLISDLRVIIEIWPRDIDDIRVHSAPLDELNLRT